MTLLQKIIDAFYEVFIILVKFIPIALITSIIKTLINLKNSAEKNFVNVFYEFIISIGLSVTIGYLCYKYVSQDLAIVTTAVTAWAGSKTSETIDVFVKKYITKMSNIQEKNDSSNNNN